MQDEIFSRFIAIICIDYETLWDLLIQLKVAYAISNDNNVTA